MQMSSNANVTSKMRTKVLLLLSAGHMVTDMAAGALPILLPIIQASLNLSYSAAGFISLIFNFSSSIIQPLLGYWSDKIKARWLLPLGCLLSVTGLVLAGIVSSYWLILAVVFLSGLGSAAYHPEGSKVSRLASGQFRTTGMSLFIVGGAVGAAVGSLVMAQLLDNFGRSATVYFMLPGLLMVALFLIFNHKLPPDPEVVPRSPAQQGGKTKNPMLIPLVLLVLVVMVRSWTQAGLTYFMPLYFVSHLGMSAAYTSTFLVSFMVAGAVGTLLGGPLADRFGRKKYLVASTALLIPLLLLIKSLSGLALMITLFITGAVLVSTMAPTLVMGQEMLPHRVGVASGLMTGFAVGMGGIGVTMLGAIADHFGAPAAFWALSIMPMIAFGLALFLPSDQALREK